jgi:hypothetical protein
VVPWIIFAVVAVPLAVLAFATLRRSNAAGEHPATEDAAARKRTEREFAEADAYEEQWRKKNQDEYHRERLP